MAIISLFKKGLSLFKKGRTSCICGLSNFDISNSRSSRTIGSIDQSIDQRVAVQLSESCPRSWMAIVYILSKVRLAGRLTRLMTSRLRYCSTFFMLNKEIVVLSLASAREGRISRFTTWDSYRNSRRQSATWEPERHVVFINTPYKYRCILDTYIRYI